MSKKKSKGLLTLITGMALGATAALLSKKENRDKAEKFAKKTIKDAKKVKSELDEDPKKLAKKVKTKTKKMFSGLLNKGKKEDKADTKIQQKTSKETKK